MKAVKEKGTAFEYVSKELQGDSDNRDIIRQAVKYDAVSIQIAPQELKHHFRTIDAAKFSNFQFGQIF